jgi:hypothetical protein
MRYLYKILNKLIFILNYKAEENKLTFYLNEICLNYHKINYI